MLKFIRKNKQSNRAMKILMRKVMRGKLDLPVIKTSYKASVFKTM